MKFILPQMRSHMLEQDMRVRHVTERAEMPRPGDEVVVLARGKVDRIVNGEVEVSNLEPVEIVEVNRR